MLKSFAATSRLGVILMITFIVLGCQATTSPALPTSIPSLTDTPTASNSLLDETLTPCYGAFTWAYGSVTPEFISEVQDAMRTAGLEGSVQASTFGENDGCGVYHVKDVDYVFTVRVESLEANEQLASTASAILKIARSFVDESPAPNLGHLQLTFQSGAEQCGWSYEDGAWKLKSANAANAEACQAPTSAETERFADVLTPLAVDLACETSTLRANTLYAELECERPEGENLYMVNIIFSLDALGYADICFHGWDALENDLTGADPMTVIQDGNTYYERNRTFEWMADGTRFSLSERIRGGPDVTLPPDTREVVYLRALQSGLIPGEGSDCR